jgi:putative polymerase
VEYYSTNDQAGLARVAPVSRITTYWLPFAVVFAAMSFNFILCFINTNIVGVTVAHVIGAELIIISLALLVAFPNIGPSQIILILGLLLYLMALSLIRAVSTPEGAFDVKIVRDFMIPIAFFLLGTRVSKLSYADSIVKICALVVTFFAIFEYFFLDLFLRYFDVLAYYVARGTIEREQAQYMTSQLYISGVRFEGRSLFPFLGEHRVSSIFLEPVSPGNFAVTLFFWALVRSKFQKKIYYGLFLMAIFLTIMADNRFGAFLCVAALCASLVPLRYLRTAIFSAPFVAIPVLLSLTLAFPNWGAAENSFAARQVYSGYVLSGLSTLDWLGIGTASSDGDSGYAYTITQIGIIGFIVLWSLFMMLRGASAQFQMYRAFCGMYLAAILCVSASPFSIKTASLLWFLLGVLAVVRVQVSNPLPAPSRGLAPASAPKLQTTPSQ